MYKMVRWLVIVGLAAVTVRSLPDLARYLKIRSL
jgi:hypothetical protein